MSKASTTYLTIDVVFFTAILSLFFNWYTSFSNQEEKLTKRVMEVNFWNPSSHLPFDSTHGNYKKVSLTGVEKSDSLKIIEIKDHLKNFKAKMDSVTGIHIVFSGNSKYGDFIQVLNYCLIEEINLYTPYKNNLWIPSNENLIKCFMSI